MLLGAMSTAAQPKSPKKPDRFRRLERDYFDVVVVGAGISSLTAAALLAKRGRSVLVLDRHYVAGGNATIFKRPGYEFDVGLHYIGNCQDGGFFPRVLASAGADAVRFREMDPDGFDRLVFPDFEFRVPKGVERYRDRLVEHFPSERAGIDRYIAFLEGFGALQKLSTSPSPGLMPKAWPALRYLTAPLSRVFDDCTRDPKLRAVLAGESGDYAQPPSRASALLHAGLMMHYLQYGAYFPQGGGQIMSDHLANAIEAHGGKVLLNASVERILVENRVAVGVELHNKFTGRRSVRASKIICGADIKHTLLELIDSEHLPGKLLGRARDWEMSPALGMVFLGVKQELLAKAHPGREFPNSNFWIHTSYDQEREYRLARAGKLVDNPFAYVTVASVKDPTNEHLSPPGVVNLQVMGLAPSGPEAWGVSEEEFQSGEYRKSERYAELKERYASNLLGTAEKVLPGIRDHIVFQEVATPLSHTRYTNSTGGTSYGIALTPEQFLHKRPGPNVTGIDGLILCGASLRTGHGISGATMSGLMAAAEIAGNGVLRETFGAASRKSRVRVERSSTSRVREEREQRRLIEAEEPQAELATAAADDLGRRRKLTRVR